MKTSRRTDDSRVLIVGIRKCYSLGLSEALYLAGKKDIMEFEVLDVIASVSRA